MNIQDRFPLGLTGLISLLSKGLSRVFSSTTVQKASILCCSAFFMVQLSNPNMTTGKTIALTRWTFVGKVISLLLNMLSRLVITFLPRSKRLLISWLPSPSAVILNFVTLWTVARQTPLSRGFSRQEYWSGLPWPPPGDLPDPGVKPTFLAYPALQVDSFSAEPLRKLQLNKYQCLLK